MTQRKWLAECHAWLDDPASVLNYLHENFNYIKDVGVFIRKVNASRGKAKAGDLAGRECLGYRRIKIHGREYQVHRLVWLIENGSLPANPIDHIDGNKLNNRIENLRSVSIEENQQNQRRPHRSSTTGLLGAHHRAKGGFSSVISVKGKPVHLGLFKTAEEAHAEYLAAKKIYHPTAPINTGEGVM